MRHEAPRRAAAEPSTPQKRRRRLFQRSNAGKESASRLTRAGRFDDHPSPLGVRHGLTRDNGSSRIFKAGRAVPRGSIRGKKLMTGDSTNLKHPLLSRALPREGHRIIQVLSMNDSCLSHCNRLNLTIHRKQNMIGFRSRIIRTCRKTFFRHSGMLRPPPPHDVRRPWPHLCGRRLDLMFREKRWTATVEAPIIPAAPRRAGIHSAIDRRRPPPIRRRQRSSEAPSAPPPQKRELSS